MFSPAFPLDLKAKSTVGDDAITSAKIKLVPLSLQSKIAHIVLSPNLLQCHIHWVEYKHVWLPTGRCWLRTTGQLQSFRQHLRTTPVFFFLGIYPRFLKKSWVFQSGISGKFENIRYFGAKSLEFTRIRWNSWVFSKPNKKHWHIQFRTSTWPTNHVMISL